MRSHPFAALCPAPQYAAAVAAVPYDVVDTAEAAVLAAGNPDSFLHVSRPEIDLPPGTDPHADAVYAQGAAALQALQARGVLRREAGAHFYVYRQIMGAHSQTSVMTCCHVDDYNQNVIRKHERTRQDKEDDRTRHVLSLNAHSGPVFLVYRDQPAIDRLVAAVVADAPLYDLTAVDSVRHTVWRVDGAASAAWRAAFAAVPLAYIADGHHRAAAAARAAAQLRKANPTHSGEEEYNWFLAALFPASQVRILPYHRCVRDLHDLDAAAFLKRVAARFEVAPATRPEPDGPRCVHMYLAGRWHRLAWRTTANDPVGRLDVSVLQERLLAPLLGIADPRTSSRIAFVGGIRGTAELTRRVDTGLEAVAFAMHPVTVDEMIAIADAGQIMPPKSTWFEPKLRSGLLVHTL